MFERLVWLAPACVVTAGLWRPRAALVSLAVLLPFFGTSRGGPYLAALDVATVAAIAVSWRERRPDRTGLDLAVWTYVAVGLASFFPLAYHPPSWQPSVLLGLFGALGNAESWSVLFTWRALLDLLLGCGLYGAARRTFADRSLRSLGLGLAGGLFLVVALGLLEHAGLIDLGGYRAVAAEGRLSSLFTNSGWFTQYVVLAAPVAAASLLAAGGKVRITGYALPPLCLVALVLAQQRGAWITALGQCGLGAFLLRPLIRNDPRIRRGALFALAGAFVLVAGFIATRPDVVPRLANRFTRSDLFLRAHAWREAGRLFMARPLLGWGIGSFHPAVDRFHPHSSVPETARGEAHSTYFHVAAERGLLGLLGLALVVAAATATVRYDLQVSGTDPTMAIGRAIALAGVALYGFFQHVWFVPPVAALVWLLLGGGPAPSCPRLDAFARRFALVGAVIAFLLLLWRVFGVEPLRAAGDYSYGFHMPERSEGTTFEWTERHAARRLLCAGDVLVLELANGHPHGGTRPVRVMVRIDGHVAARLEARAGWEQLRLPVRSACSDGVLVLELLAHPTFRPFADFRRDRALHPPNDERELGVAVRAIRFEGRRLRT